MTATESIRPRRGELRPLLMAEMGRTNLTESAACMKERLGLHGRDVWRTLDRMAKAGEIGRIGARFFPLAWLRAIPNPPRAA